jgi:hypothetical protein
MRSNVHFRLCFPGNIKHGTICEWRSDIWFKYPPILYDTLVPHEASVLLSRDENRMETDGTKLCHICFHIFMRKQKRIQKHRKQI